MKVALLTDCYLPRLGGIEVQTHDLAAQLQARGHEVEVFTATLGEHGERHGFVEDVDGVPVHRMAIQAPVAAARQPLRATRGAAAAHRGRVRRGARAHGGGEPVRHGPGRGRPRVGDAHRNHLALPDGALAAGLPGARPRPAVGCARCCPVGRVRGGGDVGAVGRRGAAPRSGSSPTASTPRCGDRHPGAGGRTMHRSRWSRPCGSPPASAPWPCWRSLPARATSRGVTCRCG